MHEKLRPWQRRANKARTPAEMLPAAVRIAPLAHELSRRLDALEAPVPDRAAVNHYRSLVRRQANDIAEIVKAIKSNELDRMLRLASKNDDYIDQQHGIAEGLGLKVCGRGK